MNTVAQVEDAIVQAISQSQMSSYLKTLRTYQGDFEKAVEGLIVKFPCVLVVFTESRYDKSTHPVYVYDVSMEFTFLLADANLRGEEERRRGDAQNPGLYRMLDDLREVLAGKTLGLKIDPIEIVSERALLVTHRFSVYEATYRISQTYTAQP